MEVHLEEETKFERFLQLWSPSCEFMSWTCTCDVGIYLRTLSDAVGSIDA